MFRWKSTNQSPVLRHLFGEDFGRLSIKELEQLEQQLDSSLRQIRSRRTQSMLNQLSQLQVKQNIWIETNKDMQDKLETVNVESQAESSWAGSENGYSYEQQNQHPQSQDFLQPLDCNPNLQIGYKTLGSGQFTTTTNGQIVNGLVPGWML
ncbi:hypothetical protein E3N88_43574 [Mikania micrantha]|uniref:K-box domain-containing protein n=1 Tax=Mikania micrantha TaxID=192012 RepID=A0A5N6LF94_9ASTR|nr:hypothetical protein E3N88_43574 [Mikania micrantha]